jgi:hypothetical protein
MNFDSRVLMLFDFQNQKWQELARVTMGFPNWSKNSYYVYFLHEEDHPSVMRVHISDHKIDTVADLKHFRQAGYWSVWLGMAPDDSPSSPRHRHPRGVRARLAHEVAPYERTPLVESGPHTLLFLIYSVLLLCQPSKHQSCASNRNDCLRCFLSVLLSGDEAKSGDEVLYL